MKKLTLIRHAKSDWADLSLDDHDRPLNKRGKRDAPFMAAIMQKKGWFPEAVFASSATRTQHTASMILDVIDADKKIAFNTDSDIYLADPATLLSIIAAFPNDINQIAIVGHNPGLTELSNYFIEDGYLDNLPTCGIVEIQGSGIGKWKDFLPERAEVKEIHFPKKYQK